MAHLSLVTLAVRDLATSARFYEALGWERSGSSTEEIVFLRGGTVALALYPVESFANEVGREVEDPSTALALATNVAAPDVVDAFLAAAVRAGGQVVVPAAQMHWGGYSGYLTDPDGHLWEVAHNPFMPLHDDGRIELDTGPDDLSPAEVRERLEAFRATADAGGGALVDDLADAAVAIIESAVAELARTFVGVPTDKVIATMSELTDRAMTLGDGSRRQMNLSAASTVVSGLIGG